MRALGVGSGIRGGAAAPLLAALFTALLAGCASVGTSAPVQPVEGPWDGFLVVEGQEIVATLRIRQDGPDLVVFLEAPAVTLSARGEGRLDGSGRARAELLYDVECPGIARLSGRFTPDGRLFSGEFRASDCTGRTEGTFSFRR
ncbi:MAG: hypothetical protein RQ751_08890 [Longimicrobiales bacterium]|nr:hypothetical protein [Longimicrobiales bacterium]